MPRTLIVQQLSNPLTGEKDFVEFNYEGQSLAQIMKAIIPAGIGYRVIKNGELIDQYSHEFGLAVLETDQIMVTPLLHGDSAGQIIGIIVIAVLSVYTAGAAAGWAAGAGFGGTAATATAVAVPTGMSLAIGAAAGAAVNIAGGLLLAQLFPPPDLPPTPGSQYSWNPQVTQIQGGVIQAIYGKIAVKHGNVIAAFRVPSKNSRSNDLNVMVSYGYGPIQSIQEIKVNDQYDYEGSGLDMHRRLGRLNQDLIPGFDEVIVENNPGYALTTVAGEYTYPVPIGFEKVQLTVNFPAGCYLVNKKGKTRQYITEFSIKVVNDTTGDEIFFGVDGTTNTLAPGVTWVYGYWVAEENEHSPNNARWVQLASSTQRYVQDITGYTVNPNAIWRIVDNNTTTTFSLVNRNQRADVYTIADSLYQIKRTTRDAFDVNIATELDPAYSYTIHIQRLNAEPGTGAALSFLSSVNYIAQDALSYPKSVLVAMNGTATEKFSGGVTIEPLVEGKLIEVWNGSTWSVIYNNNPAWVAYNIATSPVIDDNDVVVRYDGFLPEQVNLADFYAWAQLCDELVPDGDGGDEKRFVFNGIFDTGGAVWDSLMRMASTYRAGVYWNGNVLRCAIEEPVAMPTQIFSDGNILLNSFVENYTGSADRATEIEMRFADEESAYEITLIGVNDPTITSSAAGRVSVEAFGTTKSSQAWRIATYMLKKNKYLYRTISFQAYVDAIDCTIGDVVEFTHSLPDWGAGGRVKAINTGSDTIFVTGQLADAFYREIGFTQIQIDAWYAGGAGSSINAGVEKCTMWLRAANGELTQYSVFGGGWNSTTQQGSIILDPATIYATPIVPDDLFAISLPVQGASKWFRIMGIVADSDQVATITAIEYDARIFSETDTTPVIDKTISSPYILFPTLTNLGVFGIRYYDNNNNPTVELNINWDAPPIADNYSGAYVYIYGGETATSYDAIVTKEFTPSRRFSTTNLEYYPYYSIVVRPVNGAGAEQVTGDVLTGSYDASTATNTTTVPEIVSGVSNLRVSNSTGDGLTFLSTVCVVVWDAPTAEFADTNWLEHFEVNIYAQGTSTVLHTETVAQPKMTFSWDENLDSGSSRTFDVGVKAVDKLGIVGIEIKITPVNLQLGAVIGLTSVGSFGSTEITWEEMGDPSLAGYEIHASGTSGFTPSGHEIGVGTMVGRVGPGTSVVSPALADGTYYYRVGAYDVFDTVGIDYGGELTVVVDRSGLVASGDYALEMSKEFKVPVLPTDGIWSNSLGTTLSWVEHSLWYDGIEYTIAASSSLAEAVWWVYPNAFYSTGTKAQFDALVNADDDWQIALNYGSSYELLWNSEANTVIGTARIGFAAVQNAQIGDIIESAGGFLLNPGVSASGWQIDKSGSIRGTALALYDAGGNLIISAGGVDYGAVNDGPPADADVTLQQQFSPGILYNFDNADNGFTTSDITATNQQASILLEATGTDPIFQRSLVTAEQFSGASNSIIQARIKRLTTGTWQGTCFYTTAGHTWDGDYSKTIPDTTILNEWVVVEFDMEQLTGVGLPATDWIDNTITGIRFDFAATTNVDFEVDWIAIGRRLPSSVYTADATDYAATQAQADAALAAAIKAIEIMGLTKSGVDHLVLDGNTITMTSHSPPDWEAGVYSTQKFIGACAVTFELGAANCQFMMGLNPDAPSQSYYNDIDYALYVNSTTNYQIYENAALQYTVPTLVPTIGDICSVVYDGTQVKYVINGTVVYTTVAVANLILSLDSSFYLSGTIVKNIAFSQITPIVDVVKDQLEDGVVITQGSTEFNGSGLIRSTNFAEGATGWRIRGDGIAEFADAIIRGNISNSGTKVLVGCAAGSGNTITVESTAGFPAVGATGAVGFYGSGNASSSYTAITATTITLTFVATPVLAGDTAFPWYAEHLGFNSINQGMLMRAERVASPGTYYDAFRLNTDVVNGSICTLEGDVVDSFGITLLVKSKAPTGIFVGVTNGLGLWQTGVRASVYQGTCFMAEGNAYSGFSCDESFGYNKPDYGARLSGDLAQLRLEPHTNNTVPVHTADKGSLYMLNNTSIYKNTDGSTTWVLI